MIGGKPRVMPYFLFLCHNSFSLDFSWCRPSASSGSSDTPAGQDFGDGVISPSTSDRSVVPTSADAAARPVVPATSSGLSWRGFKAPKKLVVKREKM